MDVDEVDPHLLHGSAKLKGAAECVDCTNEGIAVSTRNLVKRQRYECLVPRLIRRLTGKEYVVTLAAQTAREIRDVGLDSAAKREVRRKLDYAHDFVPTVNAISPFDVQPKAKCSLKWVSA